LNLYFYYFFYDGFLGVTDVEYIILCRIVWLHFWLRGFVF